MRSYILDTKTQSLRGPAQGPAVRIVQPGVIQELLCRRALVGFLRGLQSVVQTRLLGWETFDDRVVEAEGLGVLRVEERAEKAFRAWCVFELWGSRAP